ncbi:MAG: nucleoside phosphorylase [Sulfurimonas sp.]|nr:nucleoside phosphorylase [Sulfurimonas sp.]
MKIKKDQIENMPMSPIWRAKRYDHESLFVPENMMREARRQKNIQDGQIPSICILDPDGDIVQNLVANNIAKINPYWACYHTQLYSFEFDGIEFGIVGCGVGASFAVLIAEEMFVSGCQLLISVTSSGMILPKQKPPFFILIEQALRDEGTSYHYLPPSDFSFIDKKLLKIYEDTFTDLHVPVYQGATWTTDAPFRETAVAIEQAKSYGILAVEMEASALYAFAKARKKTVICFAHVTNQMGNIEGDFEKGEANGSSDALKLIAVTAKKWLLSV